MTVAERDDRREAKPLLQRVTAEQAAAGGVPVVEFVAIEGVINADLSVGADPDMACAVAGERAGKQPGHEAAWGWVYRHAGTGT